MKHTFFKDIIKMVRLAILQRPQGRFHGVTRNAAVGTPPDGYIVKEHIACV